MSMDEAGSGKPLETTDSKPKGTRSRPAKVRKHAFQTINSRLLVPYLDELAREGGTVLSINQSQAVGGNYEVVSYKES